jgi:hypothetical protein
MARVEAPDRIGLDDLASVKAVLSGDQIHCEGSCSESVAAFYLYHGGKKNGNTISHDIKLCSATLIAKNKILTNKHCIEGVLKAGDVCDETVFADIKFPKTKDKPFASYKCKKVESASDDYFLIDSQTNEQKKKRRVPDWAVIELTENVKDRKPVTVGLSVDADPLPVTLYPVYFNVNTIPVSGVIKEVQCERVYNKTGHYIYANDSDSPLFRIEKCSHQLVQGNSGTGVFYKHSTELLGVMATADSINAEGTMAHCLPDFNSPSAQCIFPNDQKFTDVMKTISFLNRLFKNILQKSLGDAVWDKILGIEYFPEDEKQKLAKVKVEFNDHWESSAQYLQGQGSAKLSARYRQALLRLILLRVPKCYSASLSLQKDLLLVDLESWETLSEYQWAEKIQTDALGQETSHVQVVAPHVSYELRTVRFNITDSGVDKVLTLDLAKAPEPLKSLEIRIPPCP